MKKDKRSLWSAHRDSFASGLLGFLIVSAVLIWPMISGPV